MTQLLHTEGGRERRKTYGHCKERKKVQCTCVSLLLSVPPPVWHNRVMWLVVFCLTSFVGLLYILYYC